MRLLFLLYLAGSAVAQPNQPATRPASRPTSQPTTRPDGPSMVLLLVDNLAPGMTGFDGNTTVKTPNLDRLAAEGAHFTRCYTPTPQSAPARATILTGRYPHAHGVTADGMTLNSGADTFTERLKKAGYVCGFVGAADLPEEAAKPSFGLTDFVATDNGRLDPTKDDLIGRQADKAVEFIERFKDRPFFLWVSFRAPREPLEYPPGSQSQYPPDSLPLPKTMQVNKNAWPAKLKTAPPAVRFDQKKNDESSFRQNRSKYYAMIASMDTAVGRVLERLDAPGPQRNTIVVFAACHGLALGDHGLCGVGPAFFEELVRGPLVVRWPGTVKHGTRIDRVVGLVNLAPTFLELANQRKPFTMQGESLVGLLKNPQLAPHGDEQFFEYDRLPSETRPAGQDYVCPVRGVVTRNYKFIDYLDGTATFYDLKRDPDEMDNLEAHMNTDHVYKSNYHPVRQVLLGRLNAWRKQTRDPTAQ